MTQEQKALSIFLSILTKHFRTLSEITQKLRISSWLLNFNTIHIYIYTHNIRMEFQYLTQSKSQELDLRPNRVLLRSKIKTIHMEIILRHLFWAVRDYFKDWLFFHLFSKGLNTLKGFTNSKQSQFFNLRAIIEETRASQSF